MGIEACFSLKGASLFNPWIRVLKVVSQLGGGEVGWGRVFFFHFIN